MKGKKLIGPWVTPSLRYKMKYDDMFPIDREIVEKSDLLRMIVRRATRKGTKEDPITLQLSPHDLKIALTCIKFNMVPSRGQTIIKSEGFDTVADLMDYLGFGDLVVNDYLAVFDKCIGIQDADWHSFIRTVWDSQDECIWFCSGNVWFCSREGVSVEFPRKFLSEIPHLLEMYEDVRASDHRDMGSEQFPIGISVSLKDLRIMRAICAFNKKPHVSQRVIKPDGYDDVDQLMSAFGMREIDDVAANDDFVDMVRYLKIDIDDKQLMEAVVDININIDYDHEEERENYEDMYGGDTEETDGDENRYR
jgi:hypothetical protein